MGRAKRMRRWRRVHRYALQELRMMAREPGFDPTDEQAVGEALTGRVQRRMAEDGHRWGAIDWEKLIAFILEWLPRLLSILLIFLDEETDPE